MSSPHCRWTLHIELNLATNALQTLPDDIMNWKKIPNTIGQLTKLCILDLEENRIKVLPNEIGLLHELQNLTLQTNQISMLSHSSSHMTKLTHCLPAKIICNFWLENLENLKIIFNVFTYLNVQPFLQKVKNVTQLTSFYLFFMSIVINICFNFCSFLSLLKTQECGKSNRKFCKFSLTFSFVNRIVIYSA